MNRKWQPVDLAPGLRLYRVRQHFWNKPELDKDFIIGAQSPSDAAEIMIRVYREVEQTDEWVMTGHALNVYLPEDWRKEAGTE